MLKHKYCESKDSCRSNLLSCGKAFITQRKRSSWSCLLCFSLLLSALLAQENYGLGIINDDISASKEERPLTTDAEDYLSSTLTTASHTTNTENPTPNTHFRQHSQRLILIAEQISKSILEVWASEKDYDLGIINYDSSNSVYISLDHHQQDDLNKISLQEILIRQNFTLVESEHIADYIVQIRVVEEFIPKKTRTFPAKNELYRETTFTTKIVRNSDKQVMDIQSFSHMERHTAEKQIQSKWYTPLLIITVIGTLVYLIYNGI